MCFVTGHGEYDIDNFEFHTHFEGSHSHSHNTEGMALVQMEQHGLGRLRRALEKLGLEPRKVELRPGRPLPPDCAALVDANPRTPHLPAEADLLRAYLERRRQLYAAGRARLSDRERGWRPCSPTPARGSATA